MQMELYVNRVQIMGAHCDFAFRAKDFLSSDSRNRFESLVDTQK